MRFQTHIRKKVLEQSPSTTNADASSAVVLVVVFVIFVFAPLNHMLPREVLSRSFPSGSMAMRSMGFRNQSRDSATATFSMPAAQRADGNCDAFPASAPTKPKIQAEFIFAEPFFSEKATESLVAYVEEMSHRRS